MHYGVDGQWQTRIAHQFRRPVLLRLCSRDPGNAVATIGIGILQAELDMLEAGLGERRHASGIEPNPRGDQIAVKAQPCRMPDKGRQISPDERLAAREMHLQYAQYRRFAQHPLPGRGIELGPGALQRQRVRAVGATQRATMG